jgi:hypothetical protein
MTSASPTRARLGRLMTDVRASRQERRDAVGLHRELGTYRTTAELAELSGIAARSDQADGAQLRKVVSRQLSA